MTPISPDYTRGDLIAMIHQRDGLVSALKDTCAEKDKEIARLNQDRIQPSLSFHERMQRADEAVGDAVKKANLLTDLLLRWINIAENGKYGENTNAPLKHHPIIAETIAALPHS